MLRSSAAPSALSPTVVCLVGGWGWGGIPSVSSPNNSSSPSTYHICRFLCLKIKTKPCHEGFTPALL